MWYVSLNPWKINKGNRKLQIDRMTKYYKRCKHEYIPSSVYSTVRKSKEKIVTDERENFDFVYKCLRKKIKSMAYLNNGLWAKQGLNVLNETYRCQNPTQFSRNIMFATRLQLGF